MKAGSGRVWTRERAGWEPGNRSFSSGSSNQSTSPALLLCSLISQQSQQHRRQRITSFTGHRGLNTHSSLLLSLIFPFSHDKYARCILTSQLSSSNHLSRTSDWVLVAPSNIEQRHPACDLQIIVSVIKTLIYPCRRYYHTPVDPVHRNRYYHSRPPTPSYVRPPHNVPHRVATSPSAESIQLYLSPHLRRPV